MSVSKEDAKRRLNYLRAQMLRAIFGNSWKRKGGKIVFLIFKQGSRATSNQHFHVLMAIEGEHNWSELRIAMEIQSIELSRPRRAMGETSSRKRTRNAV